MKELWISYFKTYPLSTIQDFIKYLYQATLGSAHLVSSVEDNYAYLLKEYKSITYDPNHVFYEEISDSLVRVHLEAIPKKHLKTMHFLFMKSVHVSSDKEELLHTFKKVEEAIKEGWIPFRLDEWQTTIHEYIKTGCPVVSHSETFRKYYHPHYRLMKKEYVKYLDVLFKINDLEGKNVIAIDGCAGAGKSTLALLLNEIYHYPIVHVDDFFLQPHQRNKERLEEAGGNVDYERFYEEVVLPLKRKESFNYQIFDCSKMRLNGNREIIFNDKVIVEGSYSHHPYFKDYADVRIFVHIDSNSQKQRIKKRNGEYMLARFEKEWIPMENTYFDTFNIEKNSDIVIR